jgi:hypothetical protein
MVEVTVRGKQVSKNVTDRRKKSVGSIELGVKTPETGRGAGF